jgi:hypothetical protein
MWSPLDSQRTWQKRTPAKAMRQLAARFLEVDPKVLPTVRNRCGKTPFNL